MILRKDLGFKSPLLLQQQSPAAYSLYSRIQPAPYVLCSGWLGSCLCLGIILTLFRNRKSSLSSNRKRTPCEITRVLSSSNTESIVNTLHPVSISLGHTFDRTTEEHVKLFKGFVFGLYQVLSALLRLIVRLGLLTGAKEPDESTACSGEECKEDVSAEFHRVDHVTGGQADDKVEHPISRSHNRHTSGTHAVGEKLLSEHPSYRAPRVREVDREKPDEGDGNPPEGFGKASTQSPLVFIHAIYGCDDDMTDTHTNRPDDQERFSTKFVEEEYGGQCKENLQYTSNAGGQQIGGD